MVSTRYIARPASGMVVESGSHAATFSGSTFSSAAKPSPTISSTIPAIANGAATAIAKAEAPEESVMPLLRTMHAQAARTVLVLRLLL